MREIVGLGSLWMKVILKNLSLRRKPSNLVTVLFLIIRESDLKV